jgi:hypothetical protein
MSAVDALVPHLEEIAVAMPAFLGRLPPHEPRLKEVQLLSKKPLHF